MQASPQVNTIVLYLWMLLSSGLESILGMPPGERDPALLRCPPAKSLLYFEWADRVPGTEEAPGLEGFLADPEIKPFLAEVEREIQRGIDRATQNAKPEPQLLARQLPALLKGVLNHAGCLYASYEEPAPAKANKKKKSDARDPETPPEGDTFWTSFIPGVRAALIVNGGGDAETIAASIEELLTLFPSEDGADGKKDDGEKNDDAKPDDDDGELSHRTIRLPKPLPQLTVHRHEDYFILAIGKGVVEAAIKSLDDDSVAGLTQNERFTAAMTHVTVARTGSVGWIDLRGLFDTATRRYGLVGVTFRGVLSMVGVDEFDSLACGTGLVDGAVRSRTFVTTGGKTDGILALSAGRGITPEDFASIPSDADLVFALSLSGAKILEQVKATVGKVDQGLLTALEDQIAEFERQIGLFLEDDLLAAFGDVWTFYDSPSTGGLLVTGLIGGLEVRDAEKAASLLEKTIALIHSQMERDNPGQAQKPGTPRLNKRKFLDHTIYYLTLADGRQPLPLAPSFCLVEKQLLFALHPQALKAHLRAVPELEDDHFGALLEAAASEGEPEEDNLFVLPKGDLLWFSYVDVPAIATLVYPLLPYISPVLVGELQKEGVELETFSIPSAAAILPYLGDAIWTVTRTEQGILSEYANPFPLPVMSAATVILPALIGHRVHVNQLPRRGSNSTKAPNKIPRNDEAVDSAVEEAQGKAAPGE